MTDCHTARVTMVDCQIRPSDVTDLAVLEAMLEIPREKFVSPAQIPLAYSDAELSLESSAAGCLRYLMEPASFARLLQLAEIQSSAIVLDVGCATGYSTAVLARLCSSVVALEQDDKLTMQAMEILTDLEVDNAVVISGPLMEGFAREGPFDVIFIGGGAVDYIPDGLFEQLKENGKLVAVESVQGVNNIGRAVCYSRKENNFSKMLHFDCTASSLEEFKNPEEFKF